MQKFLKLSTVSILAIVAASGANAAGYTCEELIEYTSCNTGYYLNAGKCIEGASCGAGNYIAICPSEYVLMENICCDEDSGDCGISVDCNGEYAVYYAQGCVRKDAVEYEYFSMYDIQPINETVECVQCVAGTYQPSAGQYGCLECPAGSECATDGLATHTLCEIGEYSNTGATTCSSCPATGLTDKDGAVVNATTAQKGSAGVYACYIGEEYSFTDTKGTYHFKSDCALKPWTVYPTTEEECKMFDEEFQWVCSDDSESDDCECLQKDKFDSEGHGISIYAPTTKEECDKIDDTMWDGECKCVENTWGFYEDGLDCWRG